MKFPLCAFALLLGAAVVRAAPVTQSVAPPVTAAVVAEPLAEKEGLRVSVGSIELRASDPHVNVVLQNTSTKPIAVVRQGNSWGWSNLSLEICEVDGKILDKPLIVYREPVPWFGNGLSFETIEPGEAIVREVRFQVPVEAKDSEIHPPRGFYSGFPFLDQGPHDLTMRAIFAIDEETRRPNSKSWTGRIASPFRNYRVGWDDN